jgi:hypothetical protein
LRFVVSRRVAFPTGSAWKYGRALRYLAVSRHVRDVLERGGVPAEKIAVVYDGVPAPREAARGGAVVVPASGDPRKGAALAAEACRAAGVEPLVSRDLERDLERAAILVYLSESEGLGSAALLAMAAGVPVVASRVGGLLEIVEDGVTGVLADNDRDAVADAIRSLLADGHRRAQMARQAREVAAERFTVERMVCGTVEVYRGALAAR